MNKRTNEQLSGKNKKMVLAPYLNDILSYYPTSKVIKCQIRMCDLVHVTLNFNYLRSRVIYPNLMFYLLYHY